MIKVIMVEDDPMVLEVNKGFLSRLPTFQLADIAINGYDALHSIEKNEPDLVLLDMYLPDISGLDVLAEMRKQGIPADVIMITAARDAKTVHQVFRLGAVDYLVKPFRFARFRQALEKYEKMWRRFMASSTMRQEDIDSLRDVAATQGERGAPLPKGLSDITLKQVTMALFEQTEPVTAERLARHLGMSRVTVRRYLDYLVQMQKAKLHAEYGSVGRPKHYYSI